MVRLGRKLWKACDRFRPGRAVYSKKCHEYAVFVTSSWCSSTMVWRRTFITNGAFRVAMGKSISCADAGFPAPKVLKVRGGYFLQG